MCNICRRFTFRGIDDNIIITQRYTEMEGTGSVVWVAGYELAQYLCDVEKSNIVGKCMLELGAGTGLVSIVASQLGL